MKLFAGIPALVLLALSSHAADTRPRPLPQDAIVVRGNTHHPNVDLTAAEIAATRELAKHSDWARRSRDNIVKAAEPWLKGSDRYWLGFLPKPGACYAYGFSGSPIDGSSTGTWVGAHCSWDNPGHVRSDAGDVFPDARHPDPGTGYVAPDGRIYYFVGQFNAWVTEQWTVNALPALAQAYLLTGDERYAERGLLFLDALASIYKESTSGSWDYPSNPPSGRLARPWYQVARTLVLYVDDYDWMYNSPAAGKPSLRPGLTRRQNIERNMLLDGAYYCYRESWDGALHNGHADYLRGALAVGCLLDIPEYVDAAVNGPLSINVMIANNLDRDGRYYETSPGYAIHARNLYLTFADPLLHLRSKEYPHGLNLYADPRLRASLTLPDLQFQVAGRRPNFGDTAPDPTYLRPGRTFSEADYIFAERLYAAAETPEEKREYAAALQTLALPGTVEDLRERYIAGAPDTPQAVTAGTSSLLLWRTAPLPASYGRLPARLQRKIDGSWVAGMKGLALLRSGDQAALLRYGPSLNHGEYDDLSLVYYADGYELSYEIGYGLGSTHVKVGWSQNTVSHALVTVDERSQKYSRGGGGSLLAFAALPSVQFVAADSPLSYGSEKVREYRRGIALVGAGYLVDCFHVEGGDRHDYGFGSIGSALEPFGVTGVKSTPGSLAPGYAWGQRITNDGDISGYPNKPGWNPPPGNGYGFFYDVRRGEPVDGDWGGIWRVSDYYRKTGDSFQGSAHVFTQDHIAKLRLHLVGDKAEPVYATAPGLYPSLPVSSFVLARRSGHDLKSTFLAVYEPYRHAAGETVPQLVRVERIGANAVAVYRTDGAVDLLLFGPDAGDTPYGRVEFTGDFAYLTGNGRALARAETLGASQLSVAGRRLAEGPGTLTAKVSRVDASLCAVDLDSEAPPAIAGLTAIFSNPAWSRTSGYRIASVQGRRIFLEATTLSLGMGRVQKAESPQAFLCDIPHGYAMSVQRQFGTHFFDGKLLQGRDGGSARVAAIEPGPVLQITLAPGGTLHPGETFDYLDLAPGDQVRIALPLVWVRP